MFGRAAATASANAGVVGSSSCRRGLGVFGGTVGTELDEIGEIGVRRIAGGGFAHYTYYHCTKKKVDVHCPEQCIEVKNLNLQIRMLAKFW